jgi:hypothetical protein
LAVFTLVAATITFLDVVFLARPGSARGHQGRRMEDRLRLPHLQGLLRLHRGHVGLGRDRSDAGRAHA